MGVMMMEGNGLIRDARLVIASIRAAPRAQAVFSFAAGYKRISVDTRRFETMLSDYPEKLLGVYTPECPVTWIREDLEWAARRRRKVA